MKGLLLVNLGTPDSPKRKDVARYLKQFLLDPRVIDIPWLFRQLLVRGIIVPFRSGKSAKAYQELWTENGSPLRYYGDQLTSMVTEKLEKKDWAVRLAMRYQNPSIPSAIQELLDLNVDEIFVFPLFPQYASATTGSIMEEVMSVLSSKQSIPTIKMIDQYTVDPRLLDLYSSNAQTNYNLSDYDHFLFSFHGLPWRQIEKASVNGYCKRDHSCCNELCPENRLCYSAQCFGTARGIAGRLGLKPDQYTVCFQSRLGRDEWIQPYTEETVKTLPGLGHKNVLVFCPAFVADCLETTIEIGDEYKEIFQEVGGDRFDLVPSLNDDPRWAQLVTDLVLENA